MKLLLAIFALAISLSATLAEQAADQRVGNLRSLLAPPEDCEVCSSDNKDRPNSLTLQYIPTGVNSRFQDSGKATCRAGTYPTTTQIMTRNRDGRTQTFPIVQAGDIFTIQGEFSAETTFFYDGGNCFIHTSCSVPLVVNDQIGPFKVLAGNNCGTPPPSDEDCEICSRENKNRPDSLVIQYLPIGVNSNFQDSGKATCRAGTYPATTTLSIENRNDQRQNFNVQAGTIFTIQGPFDAETTFSYNGDECFIHTSCSVPLVVNDQIGPFKILAGNECRTNPPTVSPTPPPTLSPTDRPTLNSADDCEICTANRGMQPDMLTIMYSSTGMTAMFQNEQQSNCGEGTYPETTTLFFTNGNNIVTMIPVQNGEEFTIMGPFKDATTLQLNGVTTTCVITLSCEVQIVVGDQIGPFLITGAGPLFIIDQEKDPVECFFITAPPTSVPTSTPSGAPSPAPSPSPTGAPSPAPSGAPSPAPSPSPSDHPSPAPTGAPSPAPSPSPSDLPSPTPTGAPSPAPSPSPSDLPSPAPTGAPTPSPSEPPTAEPTSTPSASPTGHPSPAPSDAPSPSPSQPPTRQPCVMVNKDEFVISESIEVTYNVDWVPGDPLTNNGWICTYPCAVTDYFNPYHWRCGETPGNCVPADSTGEVTFSTGADACSINDQRWPIAPTYFPDGNLNTCNKVVIVRTTVTANTVICVSEQFNVIDTVEQCI